MRAFRLFLWGVIVLFSCCNTGEKKPVGTAGRKLLSGGSGELNGVSTLADTATVNQWIRKGNVLVNRAPDSAILMYKEALTLCRYVRYPEGEASVYNNMSVCYSLLRDFEQANYCGVQMKVALEHVPGPYFNKQRHRKLLGQKLANKATDFYLAGNFDSALTWFIQTVEILSPADSLTYNPLAWSYMGLGAVSGRLSNLERASSYFDRAQELAELYSDSSLVITILSNRATSLISKGKFDEAKAAAFKGMDLSNKIGELSVQPTLANTIAICFMREGKPQEALPYSKKVLEVARQLQNRSNMILAYYILGYNYVELKEYRIAERYLQEGLAIAQSDNNLDNVDNAYEQLAAAYEGMGRYKEALAYEKKYVTIRDSLLGHENAGRITEVETRYRVAQKDNELVAKDKALLQNRLKIASQQKRQYLWAGGALLCIVTLVGLLLYKQYRAKLAQLRATIAGEEKERGRLARELHDGIVSRLSIIKMNFSALPRQYRNLNEASDFQDVVDQLEQSITELRTTSHNLLPDVLQKAGLCASVNMYCEKIRKTTLLDIEFQLLGTLPLLTGEFELNVYRIIQELVNNILKHSNATHTLIQFQAKADWLSITIDDNGNGFPEAVPGQDGIGMKNLNDRVQLLDGTMEIEQGRGTSVYLEFNLRKFIRKDK